MRTYGISATCLIREFLVREGLCDYARARDVASKLAQEIGQTECFETDDGAVFMRSRTGRRHSTSSQLSFRGLRDVDERNWDAVDPLSMTTRLDRCS